MLLVGSVALMLRDKNHRLLQRYPKDIDIIATYDEFDRLMSDKKPDMIVPEGGDKKMIARFGGRYLEVELAWNGTLAAELADLVKDDHDTQVYFSLDWANGQRVYVPTLDVLYMLKMTHRYLKNSPHFLKTRQDIMSMRLAGARVPERYSDWFVRREKATYSYKHPSLMRSKGDFFKGDGITYIYDHDSIHKVVALYDVPAYTRYQKDGAEVACDINKWNALPEEHKLAGVLEESYVLALERSQIPFKGKLKPKQSFLIALMKVCTSITSGWFRAYAYENYDRALAMFDETYVDRFWAAVEAGSVPLHKEKM